MSSTFSTIVQQDFAYASGRTGVLQQLLLTASDRDRLLGAADLKAAESILTELKFTSVINQGLQESDEILQATAKWIREEVENMAPESKKSTFHILWIEESAPLLSYHLKKYFGLTSPVSREPQTMRTDERKMQMIQLIENNAEGSLPPALVAFVREVKQLKDPSPETIDNLAAKYIAQVHINLARKSKSPEILKYVLHRIDLANIRIALRLKEEPVGTSVFIRGGTLDLKRLTGNLDDIIKTIDRSNLPFALAENVRKASEDSNAIEHALSTVTADDIAHMWNIPLSVEPVFAFAAIALSQIKLLRVLLIGKRANMSPQEIKLMLPPFLSASHYVL